MAKFIVGIHGLSNKPPAARLREWWLRAINDGLAAAGGERLPERQFELAYWVDLMYAAPDPDPEPYTDPDTDEVDEDRNKIIAIGREYFSGITGRFGDLKAQITDNDRIEGIKNAVLKKFVTDLGQYYDDEARIQHTEKAGTQTREAIRSTLRDVV